MPEQENRQSIVSQQPSRSFMPCPQRLAKVAAALVASIGCLVLLGWIVNIPILKSVLPGLATMKANTALGFVLAGTSLFLLSKPTTSKRRLVSRLCCLGIAVLSLATLSEYLFGWNLGIDQFLAIDDPQAVNTSNLGQMSPLTAICFTLVSCALWLSRSQQRPTSAAKVSWAEGFALFVSAIAAQVLIAYLYQVQPIIGLIIYTQMAVHTAVCFIVLGVGILLAHPRQGLIDLITANSVGGVLARRLFPAAIAIPLVLGWLQIKSERISLFNPEFGTSVLVVLNITLFLGLIGWNARLLHRMDLQRQSAVEALYQANDALEAKIEERTTQLRETNERLKQSEQRLSLAIEGAGMAAWDADLQTGKAFWSAQHFKLIGYEPVPSGEATIEMWRSRIHSDDLASVMQAQECARQEQTIFSSEYRIIRADNSQTVWLKTFGRFVYNEADQVVRCVGIFFDITDSKRTQEERDRFFILSLDMLCIAGTDGYFKQLNPSWERILGYTQAELLAQPFLNFVHPEDLARTSVEADNHAAGTAAVNFENRYRCKDGSYKWLAWASVAVPENGLLYAVARDVTARKQVEQQLEQQAAILRRQADLLELTYEAIIVRDEHGAITYWNRGAESMYGWTRDEASGNVTYDFLQTQFPAPDINLDKLLLQQERWQGEVTHTCKDGKQVVVESRQVLIRDEQGTPTGFLEVNRDITERKQAETALHNLNQELQRLLAESQTLLEVIPIGIGIAEDPECTKIRVNQTFAKQLSIPQTTNASLSAPNDEKPASFKVYQNGRELTPEELPMQYAATHGVEVLDLEVDVVHDDGTVLTLLEYAAPLFDEAGNTRGSVGAFLDITDRKRAEAEVRQLNANLEQRVEERTAQLQQANEELEAFSYTIAHDLRAPLRGIQGYAQALLEDYGEHLDEIAQDYIQRIFAGIDRMNDLVQDLLAYSRLSREQLKLSGVQLAQVMIDAQAQLETELRDRQAQLIIAEPLPSVMGHRPTLVQIVVNLLSNATKFVAPGIQPQVRVWAQRKGNSIRLWVEDNGIGIEPQYQEQIFGVFDRLHGRDAYPGTGIGLAIVRKGAERLGGQAGLESVLGQGSRFWVELQGTES
jgi:PAS domain S-box-containing protein